MKFILHITLVLLVAHGMGDSEPLLGAAHPSFVVVGTCNTYSSGTRQMVEARRPDAKLPVQEIGHQLQWQRVLGVEAQIIYSRSFAAYRIATIG